jgi:hypothetical protein
MPAIKVKEGQFAGSAQLYGKNGLDALVRGLAIDNARNRFAAANVADLTDNTTGAAGASLVDLKDHVTPFNASSAGGAAGDAFTDAVNAAVNAQKTLANSVNAARTILGLPLVSATEGTQATANTLPALTKTVASASGNMVASASSAKKVMKNLKDNQRKLSRAMAEVFLALGEKPPKSGFHGQVSADLNLAPKGNLSATSDGKNAVSKADADAFLTGLANNYATLAAAWNGVMGGAAKPLSVVAG